MNLDPFILTIITFTPLVGVLLLTFLPDKGKTIQWAALIVTLLTFMMTMWTTT